MPNAALGDFGTALQMTLRARLAYAICAAMALGACASDTTGPGSTPSLRLASDGLRAGDTGLEVGFGRAFDSAVASVSQLAGEQPESTTVVPCGGKTATAVSYGSGLTLFFDTWGFRGWTAAGPALERFPPASGAALQAGSDGRLGAGMTCA